MGMKCRKRYVSVNLDVSEDGTLYSRIVRWGKDKSYTVDQILYKCRAASKKVYGEGIRYTVIIRGKEAYLFREGDKWFVETKEGYR